MFWATRWRKRVRAQSSITYPVEEKGSTYPSEECHQEKHPLLGVQHHQETDWIRRMVHRRAQRGEAREGVLFGAHLVRRGGFGDAIVAVAMIDGGIVGEMLVLLCGRRGVGDVRHGCRG
jgi:hypothetical protein